MPRKTVSRPQGMLDSVSPDNRRQLDSIFESVWGELRQYPGRESVKKEVAERVALYSNSGLQDDQRIRLAVLNSFGRPG
jgi:hypothetical protein